MENSRKIYVIGSSTSYASWMQGKLIDNMEDADVVLLTGGADVDPSYYNEPNGGRTYPNPNRDHMEYPLINKAIKLNKPIWGTCRGLQWICVAAGGKLIQDMSHPHRHNITLYDGTTVETNSLHHQMIYPFMLPRNEYHIIAYAKGLSATHVDGRGRNMMLPTDDKGFTIEPETAYFPKIRGLGQQGHPEMMHEGSPAVTLSRRLLDLLIEDTLDAVLTLKIPSSRFIEKSFVLTDDELQLYSQIKTKLDSKFTKELSSIKEIKEELEDYARAVK